MAHEQDEVKLHGCPELSERLVGEAAVERQLMQEPNVVERIDVLQEVTWGSVEQRPAFRRFGGWERDQIGGLQTQGNDVSHEGYQQR